MLLLYLRSFLKLCRRQAGRCDMVAGELLECFKRTGRVSRDGFLFGIIGNVSSTWGVTVVDARAGFVAPL